VKRPPTNVAASVRDRLASRARERGDDFQLVLTRYVNERLLYRLATSVHASRFVLKGAALFTVWTGQPHRPTRDLDLLGFGDETDANLRAVFVDVLGDRSIDDGVSFDVVGLHAGPILTRALRATFVRRGTPLPIGLPLALTPEFADDRSKRAQWSAFLKKSGSRAAPSDFGEVVTVLAAFLEQPLAAALTAQAWLARWEPGGPRASGS
jgi:hypothetical protein